MFSTQQINENLNKVGLLSGNNPIGFWIFGEIKGDISPLITKVVSIFETYGDKRLESHLFTSLEILISKKFDESFACKVIELIVPLFENIKDKFPSKDYPTTRKAYYTSGINLEKKYFDGSFDNLNDFDITDFSEE